MSKVIVDEIQTDTADGNVRIIPNGTGKLEIKGAGGDDAMIRLNCSAQTHGVKIKSPNHIAGQSYTMILPDNNIQAGKFLRVKSVTGTPANEAVGQLEYADAGGGGAYDFVSKTSLTSTASQIDFNPTGGLSTGVYKIVGKKVLRTATYKVEIAPFINGGSSVVTGGWDYVYKNYGNYSPYVNNYLQDRLVINHGGTVVAYSGNDGGESFEIDFSTENNSWIRGISQGLGSQLNRIEFSGILRHYNYAPATNRVSGLRFTVDNSGTFNVGTEMILFKLKES